MVGLSLQFLIIVRSNPNPHRIHIESHLITSSPTYFRWNSRIFPLQISLVGGLEQFFFHIEQFLCFPYIWNNHPN